MRISLSFTLATAVAAVACQPDGSTVEPVSATTEPTVEPSRPPPEVEPVAEARAAIAQVHTALAHLQRLALEDPGKATTYGLTLHRSVHQARQDAEGPLGEALLQLEVELERNIKRIARSMEAEVETPDDIASSLQSHLCSATFAALAAEHPPAHSASQADATTPTADSKNGP